ncbi:MAG TPA: hypothetical protein VJG30_00945 [Candidatus Nanoarchaeia archaeon]|nr:hypothetical protein [Candidatus Nanoarchaeia archaeon]
MKKKKYSKNNIQGIQNNSPKQSFFKDKRKISLAIGLGIILLMIFSVVGYSFIGEDQTENQNNEEDYNGYKFSSYNGGWLTSINGRQIVFENNPKDLEGIEFNLGLTTIKDKIYILTDPDYYNQSDEEIQRLKALLLTLRQNVYTACTKEEKCEDLPIINCENPNTIIYLKTASTLKGYKDENCIVLEAPKENQNKIIERFYYKISGVMP